MSESKTRFMILVDEYFNVEKIFSPLLIIFSIVLIRMSLLQQLIPYDKLVIGISIIVVALLMFIEGILKKRLLIVRIGLSPAVFVIVGLFLIFESVRRISQNFTSFSFQSIDFILFLLIFSLGVHFLHIAGLMKFQD